MNFWENRSGVRDRTRGQKMCSGYTGSTAAGRKMLNPTSMILCIMAVIGRNYVILMSEHV